MTDDEKLAAIQAAIQTDPGRRGLANLFTAFPQDFADACRSIANEGVCINIDTGFFIPHATPPAYETDGPLGGLFLLRAFSDCIPKIEVSVSSRPECIASVRAGADFLRLATTHQTWDDEYLGVIADVTYGRQLEHFSSHMIALEHPGRAADGRSYSMRGRDITEFTCPVDEDYGIVFNDSPEVTIGIGDGGNEIGMGKLPHELVAENIPNGDLIHCRVPVDHLIVAGVSNWGAYALAAGVYVLRGRTPPADLFDPERERAVLEVMVKEGPLVDGVTGQPTATVDGLAWEEYAQPLIRIREILAAR